MPRKFCLSISALVLLLNASTLKAQDIPLDVMVDVLPVETLRLSDFDPSNPSAAPVVFTLTLQNDGQERDLQALVRVSGSRSGLVGTATINIGAVLPQQVVSLTNREFDTYDLADASTALIDFALERGVLPPDRYTFDVVVTDRRTNAVVGEGTTETTTTNSGAQIDLIAPGSELGQPADELAVSSPIFQWQADGSRFDFELFEVVPGQTSSDDITTNLPVYSATDLQENLHAYPPYAERLEAGKTYAWRVFARTVGTEGIVRYPSDVLWFKIPGESSDEPIATEPPVASVELSPQEITVGIQESVQLTADVLDVNGEIVRGNRIEWLVVPSTMGTVSSTGLFTAGRRAGVAAIIASSGSVEDYATVTVELEQTEILQSDSVYVFVDSPVSANAMVEPSPVFSWHTVGADSVGPLTFTVTLAQASDNGAVQQLWQRSTTTTAMPYPSEERALEQGNRYIFSVTASDTSGTLVGLSDPSEFALARNPKLSWDLYNVWDEAIRDGRDTSSVTVLMLISTPRLSTGIRNGIDTIGGTIHLTEGPWVQVSIPFRSLEAIASLPDIRMMTVPAPHVLFNSIHDASRSGHVNPLIGESLSRTDNVPADTSSGPLAIAVPRRAMYNAPRIAEAAEPAGADTSAIDYAPIDVAVFEFGFDQLEIGSILDMNRVRFHTFRQDNRIGGSGPSDAAHGVATVKALAEHLPPSATVHLINFDTEQEFQQALRYAIDELGVKVVTCSVSWANAYDHYDGTSTFSTGIANTIGDKAALVVAAGNFAQSHWESVYSDANDDGAHNFTATNSYLDLKLRAGQPYNFLLSWADWGQPRMDLDLQILGPNGEPLYDNYGREYASRNLQRNAQFVEPIERIRAFMPLYPGTSDYRVQITSNSSDREKDSLAFELYVYPPPEQSFPRSNPGSSLASGLATTNSDLVVPVAAIGFKHSSQGPTNDGRIKPDFATSGTIELDGRRYEGTSFATPRVAAILSNILARNPSWTVAKSIAFLRSYALPPDGSDKDNVLGWGTINVEAALGSR